MNAFWYTIQTKPKKEVEVKKKLEQAAYEIFLPQMRSLSKVKPLFPSYLFIRTNFKIAETYRLVFFTRGVRRILGDGQSGPHPISEAIIETLKEVTKNGSLIEQELLFKAGDEVIVKKGILKDLCGIIEKNLSEVGRVQILFKWLNKSMRATVKYTEIDQAA